MRRLFFFSIFLVAAYYAFFGGEYTVPEVWRIRAQVVEAAAELEALKAETDLVAARAEALEHDPMLLETLARERFGMIRAGEVLYRFADEDDTTVDEVDTGGGRR